MRAQRMLTKLGQQTSKLLNKSAQPCIRDHACILNDPRSRDAGSEPKRARAVLAWASRRGVRRVK